MAGRLVSYSYPFGGSRNSNWGLWNDPWQSDLDLPRRLFDQHFGLGLCEDDLHPPENWRGHVFRPKRQPSQQASGMSEVTNTDKEFRVNLDVSHFKPEELSIKSAGNRIMIHGRHEEKQDEHGFIQREFRRTYVLPKDVVPASVKSSLSSDGILAIMAPRKAIEKPPDRDVPIERMEDEPTSPPQIAS